MRKAFFALLGAGLLMSACTISDILGIDFSYDISDPWGSWEKVEPGIYVCTDEDLGKGELIAKGTDNSMIVCETETSSPIPAEFKAYDGDKTTYEFGYGEYKGKQFLKCSIHVASEEKGSTMVTVLTDVKSIKATWGAECSSLVTFPKKFKKVHKGAKFLENYKWICQKYQTLPYQAPEDQLVYSYKEYGTKWFSNRYPSDMDAKNWVIPYSGPGKFEYEEVWKQIDWDDRGNHKALWGGCDFGKVFRVEACISGLSYEEAAAFIDKVRSQAKYNKTYEDYADGANSMQLYVYSDDSTENTEGYSGYIFPSYKVTFTNAIMPQFASTLTIEYEVQYETYI
ncbi:MAG: hypothetical protein IK031_03575 [Bacteroidales bacterium]|nr:hypothetical protein [Bacteroidales bacterium]